MLTCSVWTTNPSFITKCEMCFCMIKPSRPELWTPAVLDPQLRQQTSNAVPLSFSGTSRGPSPVTLASQDALPIAVAFTESVNAYFKGADPTKWVSHDALLLKGPDTDRHARTYLSIFELDPQLRCDVMKRVVCCAAVISGLVYTAVSRAVSSSRSACGMFCVSSTPFFQSR